MCLACFLVFYSTFPETLGCNGSTPAEEEERKRWADHLRSGLRGQRPETESYTTHLAHLILSSYGEQQQQQQQHQSTWPHPLQSAQSDNPISTPAEAPPPLRILDLCTGTGCIPLLLHSLLSPNITNLQVLGVDISNRAIALARRNLAHNIATKTLSPVAKTQIRFLRGDVLHAGRAGRVSVDDTGRERGMNAHHDRRRRGRRKLGEGEGEGDVQGEGDEYLSEDWHIVTCNPPYISAHAFNTCTARSVRTFEPMLALVPPSVSRLHAGSAIDNHSRSPFATSASIPLKGQYDGAKGDDDSGDAFYPSILSIAKRVKAMVLVMEVGDMAQAERVAALARALSSADGGKGTKWDQVVIWRDWIDHPAADAGKEAESRLGLDVDVRGEGNRDPEGNGRVVACFRGWI